MVKVSIIIPVYNTSKYLRNCLDSLVNQTLKEIEIIVINDGSTDSSKEIIEEYSLKYPNILKSFHRDNHGISETRNFGIANSNGGYITFIDSDDYIDTTAYDKAYNYAYKNNLDIVVWDFYKFNDENNYKEIVKIDSFDICSISNNPSLIYKINYAPWNKLYKKEIFDKYKFPFIKYEDFAILPQILCEAKRIGKIDEPFNYYRVRDNSETTVVDQKVFDILKILEIHYEYFKKNGYLEKNYLEFEYYFLERVTMYIIQQRYQKDKKIANKFIDAGYSFLDNKFPNWRKNKLYKKNKLKMLIEENKGLAKLYCDIYRVFK